MPIPPYCTVAGCEEEAFPIWLSGEYPDEPDLYLCPKHIGARILHEQTARKAYQELATRAEAKYRTFEINEIQVYGGGPRDRRSITIQRRRQRDGSSAWSINERGNCMGKDGEWELEPIPSSRDDAYFERMRWLSIDAVLLAWEQLHEKALEDY